jgi:hypothetical protein
MGYDCCMGYNPEDGDESIEEYLRYAAHSKGVPDDFEDWAIDNGIRLPKKKKREENYEED